ncbi:MAG: selenocysteine-specific elongation factor, partial [Abditibacteriota bacterium]|nr:selenocysteine-specific elongation factor [Abditibacteriota bacterium]
MHLIIGTAGHVDHGKTTLIRALTGIETDRLREERERGLSIVPGFAHLALPPTLASAPGRVAGIVDVPGHERFLKNMLAGVAGVDIAMLIIAADEGVMPQTVEHLHILELLQVRRAVIVLTKCDLVDADWLTLAREDIQTRLSDPSIVQSTLWRAAPLIEVSAARGDGLDELKLTLAALCDEIERELELGQSTLSGRPFRLAIDRAFSVAGFGTIVTGSATQGALEVGEAVEIWQPGQEHPATSRVRGLEVHGSEAQRVERGQRSAINLAGLALNEAVRGGVVASPGSIRSARLLDVWFRLLPDAPRALKRESSVRVHIGTAEAGARLVLHEENRLERGQST